MWKTLPIKNKPEKFKEVQEIIGDLPAYICGGAARYAASPSEKVPMFSDIDIFCADKDTVQEMRAKLSIIGELKGESPMSYMFVRTRDDFDKDLGAQVDRFNLIREFVGNPLHLIQMFDFSIARAAIIGDQVYVDPDFEQDEKDKKLRIKYIHCPISTMFRAAKYQAKGYKFPLVEMIRLFEDWAGRDDTYRARVAELANDPDLTNEQIDELEKLLRID